MNNIYTTSSQFPKNNRKKRYKVFICAGGGLFGYVITYLMSHLDFDVYQKIDVASGSSIGGILTLLYTVNEDYKYINTLFRNHGGDVFKKRTLLGSLSAPAYDNKNLETFIKKVLGDYTLADIQKLNQNDLKVIIPTLDVTLTSPRIFTNIADQNDKNILNIPLSKIGLMTAAAPTYFQAMQYFWNMPYADIVKDTKGLQYQQRYLLAEQALKRLAMYPNCKKESAIVDSGVIENIPVITTYTTLKSRLGISLEDIDMYILGTGDDVTPGENLIAENMNKWNLVDWLTKFIIKYVTESNELTSVNFGAQMGFHSFRFFNPLNVTGAMDDPKIMPEIEKQCDKVIDQFKQSITKFIEE